MYGLSDGEILAEACTGIPFGPDIVYCKLAIQKEDGVEFSCLLDHTYWTFSPAVRR
jgi:hypothetical protein